MSPFGLRTSAHGPHLVRIASPLVNCYLVREADGFTLVDCSVGGKAGAIIAAAEAGGAPIRRLVVTHAHWDHVGSVDDLSAALPEASLLVGSREAPILAGDLSLRPDEPAGKLRGLVYRKSARRPDQLLEAGDRIESLEVVPAPGHTPGQIALLDARDRTLICADAYLNVGKPFVTSERVLRFPFPALLGTWHAPTAVRTARALIELEPSRLASGHGPVVEDPVAPMEDAISRVSAA